MKRYVLHTLSLSTALLLLAGSAQGSEAREYRSADGQFRAVVISLPHAADGSGESRVEIHAASGTLLCAQDHGSADGQHGYRVERAAWTPDSRFFVYSLSSSGGHQPWHFPTHFIAVRGCKMRTLDDDVGPITAPDFRDPTARHRASPPSKQSGSGTGGRQRCSGSARLWKKAEAVTPFKKRLVSRTSLSAAEFDVLRRRPER